jgi:hypothetical protein
MDKAEFWATKNLRARFETVTFSHASFSAPIRLVKDVFENVTLGGNVYTAAPMDIKPPEQKSDTQPKLTITFPRPVVGRQFKQQLELIKAAGSRAPISVTYAQWLGDTDAPKVTWNLYVADQQGVNFNADWVQVSATIENPMRRAVAPIYAPDVFTGLQSV